MDNEDNSQREQISLYGLFGDSSTTLQGLNDHLSPSLLQQSPPCGSTTFSVSSTSGRSIVTSPLKLHSNGIQQQVFLSDLADHSPSAGSVTVASLCSHVSFDNLRCTNLVNIKGKRLCSQHFGAEMTVTTTGMNKPSLGQPIPSNLLKQTVTFASPINVSNAKCVMKPLSILKPVSAIVQKAGGVDVPDKAGFGGSNSTPTKDKISKYCVVRKVGQQITVPNRMPVMKMSEGNMMKAFKTVPVSTTNLTQFAQSNDQKSHTVVNSQQPLQAVRLNVVKNSTSSSVFPYYKKVESSATKAQTHRVNSFPKSPTPTSIGSSITQTPNKVSTQSVVVDESTLKKLVDVLNSRSDMSTQQQISLLRSMGIAVVQAPSNTNNMTMMSQKKPSPSINIQAKKVNVKKKIVHPNMGAYASSLQTSTLKGTGSPILFKMGKVASSVSASKTNFISNIQTIDGGYTVQQPNLERASISEEFKEKKTAGKVAVKRKQPSDMIQSKKSKPMPATAVLKQLKPNDKQITNLQKKGKNVKSLKIKKQKTIPTSSQDVALQMFLSCNKSIELPTVPHGAPRSLYKLAKYISGLTFLKHDLFLTNYVTTESGVETDKSKTLKHRLLKKHVMKRKFVASRSKPKGYKNDLKSLQDTNFLKAYATSQTVLNSYSLTKCTSSLKATVHHEKFLEDFKNEKDFQSELEALSQNVVENSNKVGDLTCDPDLAMNDEEEICYTIHTQQLRDKYKKLEEQLCRDKRELELVMDAYKDDANMTGKYLKSTLQFDAANITQSSAIKKRKRCHLSVNNALCCDAPALPYALYCKEHIWHCPSQCLYKLNQSMQPTADIVPEPLILVKKVRKRTKLLPLTKKHKKKKKRKIEDNESQELVQDQAQKQISSSKEINQTDSSPLKASSAIVTDMRIEASKLCDKGLLTNIDVSDLDDTKPSDTSEEDLHYLTGHEIMLNGVFDKLPEDPQDFDFFTTDKGAEELERALLLDASSPTPDHEDNKFEIPVVSESTPKPTWSPVSKSGSNNNKLVQEDVPVVVCVAPRSNNTNEQPPPIEDFNQSQCVHYTFGSSSVATTNKKTNTGDNFTTEEELTSSLISAEELQDIEGVLESLQKDAEDINSPKLPSSPAIDQYTSMLARQLSQEVETESLKQFSSSRQSPSLFNVPKDSSPSSLTRTYSLPLTNNNNRLQSATLSGSIADKQTSVPKTSTTRYISNLNSNGSTETGDLVNGQPSAIISTVSLGLIPQSTASGSSQRFTQTSLQNLNMSTSTLLPSHMQSTPSKASVGSRQAVTQVRLDMTSKSSLKTTANKLTSTPETPRKLAKKIPRQVTQTVLSPSGGGVLSSSKNPAPSSTILTNPVLPVTLMQSASQNGNVIKVIVPPGTMVNNSGGQQNMLLIPVSALMKSNIVSGSQNIPIANNSLSTSHNPPTSGSSVKTQLSSLQAGQQFFVVNNASASLQSQIALVHKTNNASPVVGQRGLVLKTSNTAGVQQNILSMIGQKASQTLSKPVPCNIKPNVNAFMKQNKGNQFGQTNIGIPSGVTIEANRLCTSSGSLKAVHPTTTPTSKSSTSLQAKVVNSTFLKQTPPRMQHVRRIRNTVKKVAKAKFDPITKKYVQGTVATTDSTPVSATTTETLSQSMMKVQQIDSVLSSLNSLKSTPRIAQTNNVGNRYVDGNGHWLTKTVVFPTTQISQKFVASSSKVSQSTSQKLSASVAQSSKNALLLDKANNNLSSVSSKVLQGNADNSTAFQNRVKSVILESEANTLSGSISNVPNGANTSTSVSSGTVHWNQTTTAGPQIAQTLTLPVYITGSLNAGNWTSGLNAINGSIAGTTVPILLPAQKITPGCQIPQRVFLGNLGSLALPASRIHTNSSNSQVSRTQNQSNSNCGNPSIISSFTSNNVATTLESLNRNDTIKTNSTATSVTAVVGTTMSAKHSVENSSERGNVKKNNNGFISISNANSKIFQAITQTVKSRMGNSMAVSKSEKDSLSTSTAISFQIPVTNMTRTVNLSTASKIDSPLILNGQRSKTTASENVNVKMIKSKVEGSKESIIREELHIKKKSGRKASHDTILHDPLMFDPTILDADSDSSEN
ncbi:uncharacterized protein LOC120343473 isoform X2 [Styela clava]